MMRATSRPMRPNPLMPQFCTCAQATRIYKTSAQGSLRIAHENACLSFAYHCTTASIVGMVEVLGRTGLSPGTNGEDGPKADAMATSPANPATVARIVVT